MPEHNLEKYKSHSETRVKHRKEVIAWDFTREQLVEKIETTAETLAELQELLVEVDEIPDP